MPLRMGGVLNLEGWLSDQEYLLLQRARLRSHMVAHNYSSRWSSTLLWPPCDALTYMQAKRSHRKVKNGGIAASSPLPDLLGKDKKAYFFQYFPLSWRTSKVSTPCSSKSALFLCLPPLSTLAYGPLRLDLLCVANLAFSLRVCPYVQLHPNPITTNRASPVSLGEFPVVATPYLPSLPIAVSHQVLPCLYTVSPCS